MKLESQVVSVDLAQELKELRVKQDSLFYWLETLNPYVEKKWYLSMSNGFSKTYHNEALSAFTVAELIDLLPVMLNGSPFQLIRGISMISFEPYYYPRYDTLPISESEVEGLLDKDAANAVAKMLIYLLKNGLMKSD